MIFKQSEVWKVHTWLSKPTHHANSLRDPLPLSFCSRNSLSTDRLQFLVISNYIFVRATLREKCRVFGLGCFLKKGHHFAVLGVCLSNSPTDEWSGKLCQCVLQVRRKYELWGRKKNLKKHQLRALLFSLLLKVTTSSLHLCEFGLGSPENRLKLQEKFLSNYLFLGIVNSGI